MSDFAKNSLLVLMGLIVGVLLTEGLFRLYERWSGDAASAITPEAVDLARLNYNDTKVLRGKDENEFRILSFGDSFAYTITKYPFSYHGIAATVLNDRMSEPEVRIVNLGLPSISFDQYIRAYLHWAPLIEHDAVVFNVYLGNDILDVAYQHVPMEAPVDAAFGDLHYNIQTGDLFPSKIPHKFPLRVVDYLYATYRVLRGDIRNAKDAGIGPYNYAVLDLNDETYQSVMLKQLENFDPTKLPALEEGYRAVARLASLVSEIRRSGKKVVVMLSPSELQVTPEKQADVARRKGIELEALDFELPAYLVQEIFTTIDPAIPVVHLYEAFVCASNAGEDLYYGTDTHWTAEGNKLAGEILARFIASQWLDRANLEHAEDPCAGAGNAPEETNSRRAALESLRLPITPDFG